MSQYEGHPLCAHFALGESIVRSTDQDYCEQLSLSLNGEKLRAAGFVPSESLEQSLTGLLRHFVGLV